MSRLLRYFLSVFIACLFGAVFFTHSVAAATCDISTNTTIDAAYVETNSCDAITLTGTPTIAWSGTIDTGRAVAVSINSGTVTFSGALALGNAGSSVTVASGATVTHAVSDTTGVQITAPTVTVVGTIDASSKGCVGNSSGTAFGPNVSTGICASGTSGYGQNDRAGAGHGGAGGQSIYGVTGGATYGSNTNPSLLGSGGGGIGSGNVGGTGGGLVRLVVSGTLTISGSVRTNGGNGANQYTGGGSGGSIYINAGTLAGLGTVVSNGGTAGNEGGGGGGGRIAVFYGSVTTFSFTSVSATGGVRTSAIGGDGSGQSGSTFILDRTTDDGGGTLRITSGLDFVSGGDYSRSAIIAYPGSQLTCNSPGSLTIQATSVVLNGATISCASTLTSLVVSSTEILWMSGATVSFTGSVTNALFLGAQGINSTSSVFTLSNTQLTTFAATSSWQNASSTVNVTKIGAQTEFQVPLSTTFTNFSFNTGGPALSGTSSLILPENISLSLVSSTLVGNVSSTFADLSIDANSTISADSRGCAPASGGVLASGPNVLTGVCATSTSGYGPNDRAGAGHGGAGGQSIYAVAGGVTYGSSTNPSLLGSGGGTAGGQSAGGTGGGLVRLRVTGTLTLNGLVKANGGNAVNPTYGGGGSGGSVYIHVGTLAGTGRVSTNGGAAGNEGGGGGGGRIAILYSQLSSFDLSDAFVTSTGGLRSGSDSAGKGSVGSVYTFQTNTTPSLPSSLGPAGLVNGSTTGTNTPTFSFTLSDPDVADTVKYQIQIDDSADFGSPVVSYTSALAAQGSQTFLVGQAAGTGAYAVGSSGQTLASGSYYWQVKTIDAVAAESAYVLANSGSIAFVVDTTVRNIQFSAASGSGLESVPSGDIFVSLDQTHFESVTVSYAVTAGNADGSGVDYTLASGTATITAGQTSTTIPFTIVNDSIDESNETLTITLSAPVYASLGATTDFAYTITDDDTAAVTFADISALTATEGGAGDSFTVVLGSAPTSTISIGFTTSTYGVTLSTSTVAFTDANWSTPVTVTVSAASDAIYEGSHTATVTPSISGTGYGYADLSLSAFMAAVTDNDAAGVTLAPTTLSVAEGSLTAGTYTAVLTSQPTSTVRISFATSTNGVTLDAAYVEFTSSNWSVPQTVSLLATDDDVAEGLHEASVLSSASVLSGFALGYMTGDLTIAPVVASITDNDSPGVFVSAATASVKEGSDVDTYTVVLTTAPTSTVSVALALSNDQVTLSASTLVFTAGNWSVPQTITVTAANDGAFEAQTTAIITHAATSEGVGYVPGLAIGSVTVTVNDNDNPGGGGVGASIGIAIPLPIPLPMPPVVAVPSVPDPAPRDPDTGSYAPGGQVLGDGTPVPPALVRAISRDADAYRVRLSDADRDRLAAFVKNGVSKETAALGPGERAALIRDVFETVGRAVPDTDLAKLADRQIPAARNLSKEQKLQPRALSTFQTIYGRKPDFKNAEENLAWNTLMYRIRFPRDLGVEKDGIKEFKSLFGRDPKDPFQWAAVRVLGYVKK